MTQLQEAEAILASYWLRLRCFISNINVTTNPLGLRKLDLAACSLAQVVKQVLVQTGVLQVIRRHLLFALDLDADVKTNSTGHGRLVRPLFCRFTVRIIT